jgi:hypothetical protein
MRYEISPKKCDDVYQLHNLTTLLAAADCSRLWNINKKEEEESYLKERYRISVAKIT